MKKTQQHLEEYRRQREQLQRQLIAIDGAIQALERLERETQGEGHEPEKN